MVKRRKSVDPSKKADHENRDPITKEPGAHPVGVGAGAAGAGAVGTAVGAVVGGPLGAVVGAAVGAVAGGLGGKAAAEAINPTVERRALPGKLAGLDVLIVAAQGRLAFAMLVVLGFAGFVEELRVDDHLAHHLLRLLVHDRARVRDHLGHRGQ